VVDQDGRPVPSAYVDIRAGTGNEMRQLRPHGGGDLDAEGRFTFADATTGPWTLRAYGEPMEDFGGSRERIVQGGDQDVKVVVRRLPKGRATLDAEVVEIGTGEPLDPAEARLSPARIVSFAGDSVPNVRTQLSSGRVTAEKLRPGKWSLFVRLGDGSRLTKDFVVGPEDTVVRMRVELGKPGAVVVRVDRSGLPSGDQPSTVAVFTVPGDAVQWMTKPGQVAPRCTRGYGVADASNDWTILFEDVTPNVPIRFWTRIDGVNPCYAEHRVTVGPGEQKDVVLKLLASAHVTFRKPEASPTGGVIVSIRQADGTWDEVGWAQSWEDGKECKYEREVLPGRLVWRAQLFSLDIDPAERTTIATAEGELDLGAGDAREIPIVFPK
jgi:hypothetical protein